MEERAGVVGGLFRERRTTKAMAEEAWPCPEQSGKTLRLILEAASWAPFHKPAGAAYRGGELPGAVPWRCYTLDAQQCRSLRRRLLVAGDESKIPKMLAVADYLLQVTWLPEGEGAGAEASLAFDPSIQNMEHIAAAAAAIQNMLLAATSMGRPNYWCSGGALRGAEAASWLGVGAGEILLGSVFVFPRDVSGAELRFGALREGRGMVEQWSRKVEL